MNANDLAGPDRAKILNCVHCGLCLSSCPTYRETKLETESPRGRIYLMRALSEGRLEPSREVSRHFDLCLNCRACETACPAGVHYGLLLETTRARLALELPPTLGERVRDFALTRIFPFQDRLDLILSAMRASARLGLLEIARGPLGRLLPKFMRVGAELWPADAADVQPIAPGVYPPYDGAPPKARVAWFRTCLMPGTFPATDRAAVHLLREAGATVVVPAAQGCCGSLHAHAGLREKARALALVNVAWFEDEGPFDLVATDVAGCGATLREYADLFDAGGLHDPALAGRARAFASRVRDITEALVELGLPPARARVEETIAIHDPCHLAHAQKVRSAPRELLRALPGVTVVELEGSDRCCGSAGIYNLVQPEMAARLLDRKMETVDASGASTIAVGNAGCLLQMEWGARRKGDAARMRHPVEILAEAYPPMTVRILWFAWLRDVTKTPAIDVALADGATVEDAFREVVRRWPDLEHQLFRLPIVLDGKVVDAAEKLRDGAELVWLPPVGGGAPAGTVVRAELIREPLDLSRLVSEVTHPSCGGVATFLGVVRDHDEGRTVVALEYDAYDTLAGEQLRAVADEALGRWPDARIAVQHRAGRLAVGEVSVAIAVACPHRAEAFACCCYVIDRVKEAVPIWKREESPDGPRWLEGHDYKP